jgi:LPS sulfotransferase NodH
MTRPAHSPSRRHFLIMGLPRSGTTYLMSLLNAHPRILCAGEQFNPYAIIDADAKHTDFALTNDRDRAPRHFMQRFFDSHAADPVDRVGFKFMIGHNIRVLSGLEAHPDLALIYVWRRNKLAQVSSLIRALETRQWVRSRRDWQQKAGKIDVGVRKISQLWHENATADFLFADWFDRQPQHRITLEYCELFQPGFAQRICDFLEVPHDPAMKSALVKQNANRVLDRFEKPAPVAHYFRKLGLEGWLEPEL